MEGGKTKTFKSGSKLGQGVVDLKGEGMAEIPFTNYVTHESNLMLVFFPIHCRKKKIDWSCVKIVKHVCKSLISEGWALWAKLDTRKKCLQLPDHPC